MTYLIVILASAVGAFLGAYIKEKGKYFAIQQEIEKQTEKIESVRAKIEEDKLIFENKYQLKHEACLEALSLIDAHFSHVLNSPEGPAPDKQFATTEHARKVHNKLILSCENHEILNLFDKIIFGQDDNNEESKPPTDLLNEFRNLVRDELGFGNKLDLNRERAWFGSVNFKPPEKIA